MGTTAPQPPPKLVLKDKDQFLEYIEGINLALGRATTAKFRNSPDLGMPAVQSMIFVDLDDVPNQVVPDANYALLLQGVSARKLAYAIVNERPAFADELLIQLGVMLMEHGDVPVIPRDHIDD